MGAPSNISLDPSSGPVGTTVTITSTDLFERPAYTVRELFTQAGTDAPVVDWKGGATKGLGIIGDSFVGNGVDSYLDYTSKLPAYTTTLCISMWVRYSLATSTALFDIGNSTLNSPIVVYFTGTGEIGSSAFGPTGVDGNRKISLTGASYNDGLWHNIIITLDVSTPSNHILIYVDGVYDTVISDNDSFASILSADTCFIGAASNEGSIIAYTAAEINNFYLSTSSVLAQPEADKLANLPTIEQDLTDITPTRYISETQCQVEIV